MHLLKHQSIEMAAINKSVFVLFGFIAIIAIVNSAPADTKNVNIFQRVS